MKYFSYVFACSYQISGGGGGGCYWLLSATQHKNKCRPRNEPKSTKTKVDSRFTISYTNVWGLRFNIFEVELLDAKPDLLFLSETTIDLSILVQELIILGYPPQTVKQGLVPILRRGSKMAETPEVWTLISSICASAWHLSTVLISSLLSIVCMITKQ